MCGKSSKSIAITMLCHCKFFFVFKNFNGKKEANTNDARTFAFAKTTCCTRFVTAMCPIIALIAHLRWTIFGAYLTINWNYQKVKVFPWRIFWNFPEKIVQNFSGGKVTSVKIFNYHKLIINLVLQLFQIHLTRKSPRNWNGSLGFLAKQFLLLFVMANLK